MILRPNILSLIAMYQCTAACEHCCFSCSPQVKDRLPPKRIADFIRQAKQFGTIKVVAFTGGECFLLGKNLEGLVSLAKSEGYLTRTVTNGYWAISEQSAMSRLGPLIEKGLDEINFSTGYFHQKYVPIKNIIYGITVAIDLGLHAAIMVEDVAGSSGTLEKLMESKKIANAVDSGRVRMIVSPWMVLKGKGRIATLPHKGNEAASCTGCHTVLSVLAITPDEDLYACCGLTMREIPEMKLLNLKGVGNIHDAIERIPDDFLKIWLSAKGPLEILKFAAQYDTRIKIPPSSVHACEICHYLYSNSAVRAVLRDHPHPQRNELITDFFKRRNITQLIPPKYRRPQR